MAADRAPLRRIIATAAATIAVVGSLAACGGGSSGPTASCGAAIREPLDTNLGHILPGAAEPAYITDPPTSGRHAPGAAISGVLATPLDRPNQVGALEGGVVLVQYRDPGDLDELRPLATGKVVVAPNPGLHDRVVATAWLFKQACSRPDPAAMATFAAEHAGKGPGTDG